MAHTNLVISLGSKRLDTVTAVKSGSDLLVGGDESLEFAIEVSVLASQYVAVVLQGFDLTTQVAIAASKAGIGEAEVIMLAAAHGEVFVGGADLGVETGESSCQIAILAKFSIVAAGQVGLLGHLDVKSSLEVGLLLVQFGKLITSVSQVRAGASVSVSSAAVVTLTSVKNFREFSRALLELEEIKVSSLETSVSITILTFLVGVEVAEAVDFELVTGTFLLKLAELIGGSLIVLAEGKAMVLLALDLTLHGESLSLTTRNLLTETGDVALGVIVSSVLVAEEISSVINIFLEAGKADAVGVVAGLEVIVLEELLVLEVSEFSLDCVKLVAQSHVVLITLLNFENLGLELRNQEVLLIRSQVDGVVVLYHKRTSVHQTHVSNKIGQRPSVNFFFLLKIRQK